MKSSKNINIINMLKALIFSFFLLFSIANASENDKADISQITSSISAISSKKNKEPEIWQNFEAEIFGQNLFQGNFRKVNFSGFNPNYSISVDDEIILHFWGAISTETTVKVDPQGNIFIPEIGNIKLLGVLQKNLNSYIKTRIEKVFNKNVEVYANLSSSKKVKIFVSGFVQKPGLYEGMSAGSILSYIDNAGGIDSEKGSFRNIELVRNNEVIHQFDLYDFLLNGHINYQQLHEGDVIKINPLSDTVTVVGDVHNENRFELNEKTITGKNIANYANPFVSATDVNIIRNNKDNTENFNLTIAEFENFTLVPGDKIEFLSHTTPSNIIIMVEGEHKGKRRLIMPYNQAKLSDVAEQIIPNNRSAMNDLILYRKSAAKRQKEVLEQVLDLLEQKINTYTPISVDDATIHQKMTASIQQFIKKARNHKPNGMINIYGKNGKLEDDVYLEDHDIIHIPKKTNLVSTFGYVNAPSFMPYKKGQKLAYYLKASGGLSESAEDDYFLLRKLNGTVIKVEDKYKPEAGDEIIALPKLSTKTLQLSKDIFQIIYQMAVSARVLILL